MEQIPGNETQIVREVSMPLFQAKGWMRFLGVMSIVAGVMLIPTIGGILFCWLPIWMGVLLWKAASEVEIAQHQGNKLQMVIALDRLKTYFLINGITALIALAFTVVSFLIFGGMILAAIMDAF